MTAPIVQPPRDFTYITPSRRRLSEYEAVTCHIQPSPDVYAPGGWPLRTPEGRVGWEKTSTDLTHPRWYDFRDPAQHWQRTYVRMQAEQERSIERACADAARGDAFDDVDPAWLKSIIGSHYRIWSYFEYAAFRAFAAAQREALSATLGNALCFQSVDHIRHAQAIVIYLMDIEDNVEGFVDEGSKLSWMEDATYQPMRRLAEKIMLDTTDWAELAIAINLVVNPLLARVGLSDLVRRFAPFHGDTLTPFIVGTVERDQRRNRDYADALVRMVVDPEVSTADSNRAIIQRWIGDWAPLTIDACQALAPVFDRPPLGVVGFAESFDRALDSCNEHLASLDLDAVNAP